VWDFTDPLTIDAGEHTLALEGERGFNAVNLFMLMPEDAFKQHLEEEAQFLKKKRVLYLLEAESDLTRLNARITPYAQQYSTGRAVEMTDLSRLTARVQVLNTDVPYRLAVRASTSAPSSLLAINVNGKVYLLPVEGEELRWYYTPPINLTDTSELSITSNGSVVVDTVALFSLKRDNDTLANVLRPEPPYVHLSFTKIDPTKYIVHVNTPRPFILIQGQSFEPNWAAYIGERSIYSRIFYSFLNGYYIDEVGNYTLILEYKPQTFVPYAALVSFITVLFCIVLLMVDFRRSRREAR